MRWTKPEKRIARPYRKTSSVELDEKTRRVRKRVRKREGSLGKYWISPELTSLNRLPMLNIAHLHSTTLNGQWRFQLLKHPEEKISRSWSSMSVPGLWTMVQDENGNFPHGDKPIYTNTQMPFDLLPPIVPHENPTGIYERDFEFSDLWRGKRVVLTIGGFESVASLYINGQFVGLAKGLSVTC